MTRQYDRNSGVEVDHMCRKSFDKILPFFVKEQSPRSCLCVNCYKGKLISIGLSENWSVLHHGAKVGDSCSCTCSFCKEVGCGNFLRYESDKSVFSMGKFSDLLMCEKEHLYTGRVGEVEAHRLACVSGHCKECKSKQDRFFQCPRHRGVAHRHLASSVSTGVACEAPGHNIQWKEFTTVDETGRPNPTRRGSRENDGDEDDEEWTSSGSNDKARQKKVLCGGCRNVRSIELSIPQPRRHTYMGRGKLRMTNGNVA